MAGSWTGIQKLRELFGGKPADGTQRYKMDIDLAVMGTRERVVQCKRIRDFWQRMRDDALEACEE